MKKGEFVPERTNSPFFMQQVNVLTLRFYLALPQISY